MTTPDTARKTAVILLAYGGPNSLEDIPAYLLDIRGGRHTPQHLVDEITDRYAQIGGRSPLLEITSSVAAKLSESAGLPVYVGMRHWTPFISDTVAQMADDGIEHVIAICMAPHFSMLSIGVYEKRLEEAIQAANANMTSDFIKSWHTQPEYLEALARNVRATLQEFPEDEREQVLVVFSAHSLPEFILERGDPYDAQLNETAALLAEELELPDERWMFSYQSAAKTGVPWLGPQIEDLMVTLAERGETRILIAPIGFIADHVEVLYDIDIGVQNIAKAHGVTVKRPPMLNEGDAMVRILKALIMDTLAQSVNH
jgi:ferrochelatase